jgi:tRNA(Ile)-lysidine synthase
VSDDTFLAETFARSLNGITGPLGLAVSGGGDSVAMLRLALDWATARGVGLFVYSVDHGLRPEAADEVRFVAALCQQFGVTHRSMAWGGWNGQGNLSADARRARYDLIANAAHADGVATVLLAHTQDDQAETVLMALARRAGVDGLSGMPVARQDRGLVWQRPLLYVTRQRLRDYLTELGQDWVDDPTNEDSSYERVRMRQSREMLDRLGLTLDALSDVAGNMQRVRAVMDHAVTLALKRHASPIAGAVKLAPDVLNEPAEVQRRLLTHCIAWTAPLAKPARGDEVQRKLADLAEGRAATLQGCLLLVKKDAFWIVREPAAADHICESGAIWDGKWKLSGPEALSVRALGEEGLKLCPNWRDSGLLRPILLASPAIWDHSRLIAAPLAGYGHGWSADLHLSDADFFNAVAGR